MSESAYDAVKLRISVIAKGDRGHSTNKNVTWGWLIDKLSTPHRDTKNTLEDYLSFHIDQQNKLKDVGSFVGGPFRDGLRKGIALIERSIVTLDIDSATPRQIDRLKLGISDACDYEFFGSTTRKHTEEKPRWRLVFPLSRPLTIEEYAPLARILASRLFKSVPESMDATDDVSYRPAQVMYWPSVCKGALFEKLHNKGALLDPDDFFESVDFDWTDWANLPFSEARGAKRPTTGKKAEVPTEKKGIVGAFCRAFDVPAAIERFIPEVYTPGDENSTKPRYTYTAGSSSNGAVIEDDGLFLYSHHGTDPCAERLVNAFDLVRIHKFGDMDDDLPEGTSPTDTPSYREMVRLCKGVEEVQMELPSIEDDFVDESEEYGRPEPKKKKLKAKEDDQRDEEDDQDDEEPEEEGDTEVEAGPDMSILQQSRFDAPEFPHEVLGPFWSQKVRQWADDAASSVDFTGMSLLTAAASTIGNARWVRTKRGWSEPCVLWTALVGSPSSNKSPALKPVSEILKALQRSWKPIYDEELRNWQAEKKHAAARRKQWENDIEKFEGDLDDIPEMPRDAVEPPAPIRRLATVGDITVEKMLRTLKGNPRGFLNLRDEMSGWYNNLSRYSNGTDRPIWLEAYGGRYYSMSRVKDEGEHIEVDHFSVSILGGVQPDKLVGFLNSDDDGMQARFMYAWPELKISKPSDRDEDFAFDEDDSDELDQAAFSAFRRLSELDMDVDQYGISIPHIVKMSRKARIVFHKWSQNRRFKEANAAGLLMGAFGKADGLVARLACVLQYLWWSEDICSDEDAPELISLRAVKAAIRLREEYVKPMQIRSLGHAQRSASDKNASNLARWIVENSVTKFSVRDVTHTARIPGLDRDHTREVISAVETLESAGWLKVSKKEVSKKGGRPAKVYLVDKAVLSRKK